MLLLWKPPITIPYTMGKSKENRFFFNLNFNNTEFLISMPLGSELEISGCVYDDADQIRFDLQCHPTIKMGVKVEKFRVIAMHINPR